MLLNESFKTTFKEQTIKKLKLSEISALSCHLHEDLPKEEIEQLAKLCLRGYKSHREHSIDTLLDLAYLASQLPELNVHMLVKLYTKLSEQSSLMKQEQYI